VSERSAEEADTAILPRIDAPDPLSDTAILPRIGAPDPLSEGAVRAPVDATATPADTVVLPRMALSVTGPAGPSTPAARGWWRRNRWGLVALVPALVLALGPDLKDGYELVNRLEPRQAVTAGADGWAGLPGTRIRLVELATVTVTGYGSRPFPLPDGVRAWRARLDFETTDPERVKGCQLSLEDRSGRLYGADPDELDGSRVRPGFCTPEDDGTGPAYEREVYFVMPESADPAAVRIVWATQLPRYLRLAPA
jgi:hypothetical protein